MDEVLQNKIKTSGNLILKEVEKKWGGGGREVLSKEGREGGSSWIMNGPFNTFHS